MLVNPPYDTVEEIERVSDLAASGVGDDANSMEETGSKIEGPIVCTIAEGKYVRTGAFLPPQNSEEFIWCLLGGEVRQELCAWSKFHGLFWRARVKIAGCCQDSEDDDDGEYSEDDEDGEYSEDDEDGEYSEDSDVVWISRIKHFQGW
ncbi:hypothetical protein LTR36_007986 [Oleoguttula mirabilis]|uniref:Uncharacterized protein n=1 Tax=Oleoguttula mirabilis TaxID=1507867 RepID=A0AAV9J987_9PEZI|nr:hypothetical protein LTR36_007986 [Oleoguttula mirabilis]